MDIQGMFVNWLLITPQYIIGNIKLPMPTYLKCQLLNKIMVYVLPQRTNDKLLFQESALIRVHESCTKIHWKPHLFCRKPTSWHEAGYSKFGSYIVLP